MRRRRWEPSTKTDYLWRPITSGETSGASSFGAARWLNLDAAFLLWDAIASERCFSRCCHHLFADGPLAAVD